MKSIFVLAFTLMSTLAQAGSVDAITSIIPVGIHPGTNIGGECSVTVKRVNYPNKAVTVTVSDSNGEYTKLVDDGTDYQTCSKHGCGNGKIFLQIDRVNISNDGSSYTEKILRTALSATNEGKLYVVVAERTVINRDFNEQAIECDIDL